MAEQDPGKPASATRIVALFVAVALLAALPYLAAGVGGNFILFDDPEYVTENPHVLRGLGVSGVRWALTAFHSCNWHPLTWLSHMLDVTLFGLDARGHHATNILLHALNAGLLFLGLQRLSGAVFRSAFVATLFGVHPLRVESVAWVAERKDVLAGLFFMLVLLAWERYARRGGGWRYLLALALFAAGLATKPMLVTLPFVLLLVDVWPLGRAQLPRHGSRTPAGWMTVLLEKVPFLTLAAVSSAVTVLAQRECGALAEIQGLSLGARLANAVVSCATYFLETLWPAGLAVYYPYPHFPIPWPTITATVLLLALITLTVLRRAPVQPYLALGWCWFLGMLVPVTGLVQTGAQARADRYTYLPLVGVFLAAAWLAAESVPSSLRRPRLLGALAAGVVAACLAASAAQARYWRDSEALYRRTLSVTKDNWLIQNNLANALAESGRHEEAVALLREAIRIQPDYAEAHNNLGISLAAFMRFEEAVAHFREAIRLNPGFADARYNLGTALAGLRRHEEAVTHFREAIRLSPNSTDAHSNLGISLDALMRHEEAVAQFREAIRLNPASADAYSNLGMSLAALGRHEDAEASFREAIRIAPDHAAARAGLSWLARRRSVP